MSDWNDVYVRKTGLICDFCSETYSTVDRDESTDDWLNACERCAAEGAAQIAMDEILWPPAPEGPEVYTYSPDRPQKVHTLAEIQRAYDATH